MYVAYGWASNCEWHLCWTYGAYFFKLSVTKNPPIITRTLFLFSLVCSFHACCFFKSRYQLCSLDLQKKIAVSISLFIWKSGVHTHWIHWAEALLAYVLSQRPERWRVSRIWREIERGKDALRYPFLPGKQSNAFGYCRLIVSRFRLGWVNISRAHFAAVENISCCR